MGYIFNAQEMGEITKKEFTDFCSKELVPSASELKKVFTKKEATIMKPKSTAFRDFYRWSFEFYKEEERKKIDKADAIELWGILLEGRTGNWNLQDFLDFVKNNDDVLSISRDLWEQLYEFLLEVKADLSNWSEDDSGCWPSVIDEYVEYKTN